MFCPGWEESHAQRASRVAALREASETFRWLKGNKATANWVAGAVEARRRGWHRAEIAVMPLYCSGLGSCWCGGQPEGAVGWRLLDGNNGRELRLGHGEVMQPRRAGGCPL